jgi:hypothetical protein
MDNDILEAQTASIFNAEVCRLRNWLIYIGRITDSREGKEVALSWPMEAVGMKVVRMRHAEFFIAGGIWKFNDGLFQGTYYI